MSGLVLSARKTARIATAKLGQRPKQDIQLPELTALEIAEIPTAAIESSAKQSLSFQILASKNPALNDLVAALDLVEASSTVIKPEPLPALMEQVATEPLNPKLKEIAQRTFARAKAYQEEEAVNRLATVTNVTPDRARNGIAKMYAQCILSLTLSNEYYLADSTPF